jgi:hypothetical protein
MSPPGARQNTVAHRTTFALLAEFVLRKKTLKKLIYSIT